MDPRKAGAARKRCAGLEGPAMWFLLVCAITGPYAIGPVPVPAYALVGIVPGRTYWLEHKPQLKDVALCLNG